jgi:hypothetical protein
MTCSTRRPAFRDSRGRRSLGERSATRRFAEMSVQMSARCSGCRDGPQEQVCSVVLGLHDPVWRPGAYAELV